MILSHTLLHPITYKVQDPFASIIDQMEIWLKEYQPLYYAQRWQIVKYDYLKRILGLAKNGPALRGHAQTAPNHELGSVLLDIYHMLDHCVYFTSRYWRAFFYWLKSGKFNPSWPQFSQREVCLALSILRPEDLEILKIEAAKEWIDPFTDNRTLEKLFTTIKKPVHNLCYKRASFLGLYDPALYSVSDLKQHAYEAILVALRNHDYFTSQPNKMVGWTLKCADNAMHNLRDSALAGKRSRIIEYSDWNVDIGTTLFGGKYYTHRECYLSAPIANDDSTVGLTLMDSIHLLGHYPRKEVDTMENNLWLNELLGVADPKINTYLRTICGGEHNPDFWSWFYYNEPSLAQRISYVEENPEALGPFLQRHLDLPTHTLVGFLRQHLPDLLSKLSDTPRNRALLAYA